LSWLLFFRCFSEWLLIVGKAEIGNEDELAAVILTPSQTDRFDKVDDRYEWNLVVEYFGRKGETLLERYHKYGYKQ
jgi:hypothetical protein